MAEKTESAVAKLLIGGGITWTFELMGGHQLEFLKIMKQTSNDSYLTLLRNATAQKGIAGLWDGFFPWGSVQAVLKGSVFGWGQALSRRLLEPMVESETVSADLANIMSGGIGGGVQGIALSPALLLKTRVMTDPIFRKRMSTWQTMKASARVGADVVRKEGLAALMKGSVVFSGKRVADWTSRYFFAVSFERLLFKKDDEEYKLSTLEAISAGLLGGVASACVTIPVDVMVAQIQQASKAGSKVTVVDTFRTQFRQGGWNRVAGFATGGFVARVAHVAITTAMMKTATSKAYEMYYGIGQDSIPVDGYDSDDEEGDDGQ